MDNFEKTKQRNRRLIQECPEIVLDAITRTQSTFTRRDMARILNRYIDDRQEFQYLQARLEASDQIVKIANDDRSKESQFTTRAMIALELSLLQRSELLSQAERYSVSQHRQNQLICDTNEQMQKAGRGSLSADQMAAIHHMTERGQLKVVVGYAGAGKTTCLETAKTIWEEEGYRVVGAAPTGKAADNLAQSGIASKTLHKWEFEWKRDREVLGKRDILVVDEAGMIDSRRLNRLLEESQDKGFKVVLVGDPEQLSPIEAGCGIRTVMDTAGFITIDTIQRQQHMWQREATKLLATQQTVSALEVYEEKGSVHLVDQAKDRLIERYVEHMKTKLREEPLDCLILAHTNKDVQALNCLAREKARDLGRLQGSDHLLTVTHYKESDSLEKDKMLKISYQEKSFAIGEHIVFLRNDYELNVKNGQRGVIQKIDEGMLQVELERGKVIQFDRSLYSSFDYGYATTIHKSQGATVDHALVYASQGLDRHLTYVALSRHKQDVEVYAEAQDFKDTAHLFKTLSRDNPKENVLDYGLEAFQYQPSYPKVPSVSEKIAAFLSDTLDKAVEKTQAWFEKRDQTASVFAQEKSLQENPFQPDVMSKVEKKETGHTADVLSEDNLSYSKVDSVYSSQGQAVSSGSINPFHSGLLKEYWDLQEGKKDYPPLALCKPDQENAVIDLDRKMRTLALDIEKRPELLLEAKKQGILERVQGHADRARADLAHTLSKGQERDRGLGLSLSLSKDPWD